MINEATPLPLTANGRILKDSARIVPDSKTGVRFGVRVDSHTFKTVAAHAVGIGGDLYLKFHIKVGIGRLMPYFRIKNARCPQQKQVTLPLQG
jgi:hypothetical protein